MRPTRRGVAVLAGALCCYLLGELAGYALFRALAGIAAGGVLAALLSTRFRPRVEITRTVYPDRIERGRPALASLVVRNPTARWHSGFAAMDRVGAEPRRIQVRSLGPGAEATYHYELPTAVRGVRPVGPLTLDRGDPFDLVRSVRSMGGAAELRVYPRRHPVRPARVGHLRHHHDGPVSDPPLHGSTDLRAVREYVVGDEVRHVHWKATARTGQLMVREYADPVQMRLTVVLDTGVDAMGPAVFEEAVDVAASLAYATTAAGQQCRLITPTGTDITVNGGVRMARELLDALCVIDQGAADPAATARPGGALVVVTGLDTDVVRWRPETVIRLGGPESMSGTVITAPDAERATARWNALRSG